MTKKGSYYYNEDVNHILIKFSWIFLKSSKKYFSEFHIKSLPKLLQDKKKKKAVKRIMKSVRSTVPRLMESN